MHMVEGEEFIRTSSELQSSSHTELTGKIAIQFCDGFGLHQEQEDFLTSCRYLVGVLLPP